MRPDDSGSPAGDGPSRDERRLALVMHVVLYALLATCLARYVQRHTAEPRAPWVVALAVALAVLYAAGTILTADGTPPSSRGRASRGRAPWPPAHRPARLVGL